MQLINESDFDNVMCAAWLANKWFYLSQYRTELKFQSQHPIIRPRNFVP